MNFKEISIGLYFYQLRHRLCKFLKKTETDAVEVSFLTNEPINDFTNHFEGGAEVNPE